MGVARVDARSATGAACRSYLLNEAEQPDNRLAMEEKSVRGAKRRSTEKNLRAGRPAATEGVQVEGAPGGGTTIKVTRLLITDRFQHRRPAARPWSEYY